MARIDARHLLISITLLMLIGCGRHGPTAPPDAVEKWSTLAASDLVSTAGWSCAGDVTLPEVGDRQVVTDWGQQSLPEGIAHYWWDVQTDSDPPVTVRLHRVIAACGPNQPQRPGATVFALPGRHQFTCHYLPGVVSTTAPDDWGLAHFLAAQRIDVWGLDPPEALIADGEAATVDMSAWDLNFMVGLMREAIAVARTSRTFVGCPRSRVTVLGYGSEGPGLAAYAALDRESQLAASERMIDALVAIEMAYKTDDAAWGDHACATAARLAQQFAAGRHENTDNLTLRTAASLALVDPDGPSPMVAGLDNRAAVLSLLTADWQHTGCPAPYHSLAGEPTGLRFTRADWALEVLAGSHLYDTTAYLRNVQTIRCGNMLTMHDDHLAAIEVPVLAVGAGGGHAEQVGVVVAATASNDATVAVIGDDRGSLDLLWAEDAAETVWTMIATWILARNGC